MTTYINPGLDVSGNGNNWTTNNINWTSDGTTFDTMTDVPTLTSATTANYPVLNPLANGSATITNGNLSVSGGNDLPCTMVCPPSGHWYVEFNKSNITSAAHIGVYDATSTPATINKAILYAQNGGVFVNNSQVATFATYGNADIVGMGVDIDTGNIYFSVNNTYQGSVGISSSGIATNNVVIGVRCNSGVTADINFGQRPFVYPPTAPVKALNTFNLPTPTIGATETTLANQYMDVVTYTGNGTSNRTITGVGFQPDFVWIKDRTGANSHVLYNSVTGGDKQLFSNLTNAEQTNTDVTNGFASDGFIVGSNVTGTGATNLNGNSYVAWNWKANGTGVSNTAGSITSTVSANTSSGFSVVTYTGNAATSATIGHGLGVAPDVLIVKNRQAATTSTNDWNLYFRVLGTGYMILPSTNGYNSGTNRWNGTNPTSTVFSVGGDSAKCNNEAINYVAYCFNAVAGYSAFGKYTGNGSANGTFVYTGFRPRYLLVKMSSADGYGWNVVDAARSPYNAAILRLMPQSSNAEDSGSITFDLLSNGFKVRDAGTGINENGTTYVYMAFAENPFKYANAR